MNSDFRASLQKKKTGAVCLAEETLTPHGHLVSIWVSRGPQMSILIIIRSTVMVHSVLAYKTFAEKSFEGKCRANTINH